MKEKPDRQARAQPSRHSRSEFDFINKLRQLTESNRSHQSSSALAMTPPSLIPNQANRRLCPLIFGGRHRLSENNNHTHTLRT